MKKINFSDKFGLTEAVLSGRKTQTRRIVKFSDIDAKYLYDEEWNVGGYVLETIIDRYARYKVGEVVAVAQSYHSLYNDECDPRVFPDGAGWTNKMFVRADLMPHQIRFTGVRMERLQDISDEDCIKEGIWMAENVGFQGVSYWYPNLCNSKFKTPREAYAALIDRISGKGTFESNPYVFVYEFELIK